MDDTIDLLKIKIERAKTELPPQTVKAIDAVDWRAAILQLRDKKGFTFEQLGDLELETELLLCGLLAPENYPKEIERRMQISKMAANELASDMNELVFKKIREELIKNTERRNVSTNKNTNFNPTPTLPLSREGGNSVPPLKGGLTAEAKKDKEILKSAGIEILTDHLELPDGNVHPILAQKMSSAFQTPVVKTEHTLENISKTTTPATSVPPAPKPPTSYPPKADPYRLSPDE